MCICAEADIILLEPKMKLASVFSIHLGDTTRTGFQGKGGRKRAV